MRKKRPRTARRADERAARELVRDRERLAALSPGGAPDRPILVDSPAVIEVRAASLPCIQCEGALTVDAHEATVVDGEALRVVRGRCRTCHTPRTLWFQLAPPRLN